MEVYFVTLLHYRQSSIILFEFRLDKLKIYIAKLKTRPGKFGMLPVFIVLKFQGNTAIFILLHDVHGCLLTTTAKLISCNTKLTYLLPDPLQEKFAFPWL